MAYLHEYLLKCVLVGDSGVGKSCLLLRFTDDRFQPFHDLTIGVEYGSKILNVRNRKVKVQVWDTAGQEKFRSIVRSYYRGTCLVFFVYSVTDRTSFQRIEQWVEEVENLGSCQNMVRVLVGNKLDAPGRTRRDVSTQEGEETASALGFTAFFETSAKTGLNCSGLFQTAAELVLDRVQSGSISMGQGIQYVGLGPSAFEDIQRLERLEEKERERKKTLACCSIS